MSIVSYSKFYYFFWIKHTYECCTLHSWNINECCFTYKSHPPPKLVEVVHPACKYSRKFRITSSSCFIWPPCKRLVLLRCSPFDSASLTKVACNWTLMQNETPSVSNSTSESKWYPFCNDRVIRTANPCFSPARARFGFDPVGFRALAREVLHNEKSSAVAREVSQN